MNSQFVNKNAGKSAKLFRPLLNKNKTVAVQSKSAVIPAASPRLVSVTAAPSAISGHSTTVDDKATMQSPRLALKKKQVAAPPVASNEDKENSASGQEAVPVNQEAPPQTSELLQDHLVPKRKRPLETAVNEIPATTSTSSSSSAKPAMKKRSKLKEKADEFEQRQEVMISIASLCKQKEKRKPRKSRKKSNNPDTEEPGLDTASEVTSENNQPDENGASSSQEPSGSQTIRQPQNYSGPRVRIVNGQITVDEESLETQVDTTTTPTGLDISSLNQIEEHHETRHITSNSFRSLEKPYKWSAADDVKFYRGLMKWGTDFEMIAKKVFDGKVSRRVVKLKYNKEEKRNPAKIDQALARTLDLALINKQEGEKKTDEAENANEAGMRANEDPEYKELMRSLILTARQLTQLEDEEENTNEEQ